MFKGMRSYDKELAKHDVTLDRKKPDDRKVEIDTSRKAPVHNSNQANPKPVKSGK